MDIATKAVTGSYSKSYFAEVLQVLTILLTWVTAITGTLTLVYGAGAQVRALHARHSEDASSLVDWAYAAFPNRWSLSALLSLPSLAARGWPTRSPRSQVLRPRWTGLAR